MRNYRPWENSGKGDDSSSRNTIARKDITAIILRLMTHYWTADDQPEARREQLRDWVDDLVEFSVPIVAEAVARLAAHANQATPAG